MCSNLCIFSVQSPHSLLCPYSSTKGPISYYSQDDTTSVEGHLTSESEEDSKKKPVVHKLLLDKMNFPDEWKTTVERIRAERESLREKFEAEKERLRIKIERNKKVFTYMHIHTVCTYICMYVCMCELKVCTYL